MTEPTPPQEEPSARDIAMLFARDPLKHTKEDLKLIVAEMRKSRHLFNNPAAKKESKPKALAAPKAPKTQDLGLGLSIKDILG